MKKALSLFAFTMLFASQTFAAYIVVLKDGTRYVAKSKWTVVDGKARITLENGQTLQLDPALIDVQKSEQLTKMGITTAGLIDLSPQVPKSNATQKSQQDLGSTIKLRKPGERKAAEDAAAAAAAPPPPPSGSVSPLVIAKFDRAYEEVGIFEKKITSNGTRSLRAELTLDTEERVFNAISATSFLMVRNAGVDGAQLETVELFMKTTTGGAAGRFQMTRADAEALDKRTISQQDYFIRNVIY